MAAKPYPETPDPRVPACPINGERNVSWTEGLPSALAALVVPPTRFEIHNEYEMQAERILGRDASNAPCYNAFRHVVMQLRSDDGDAFYEAPARAETVVAWRLVDARWLICRLSPGEFDCGKARATYSLSDVMPK